MLEDRRAPQSMVPSHLELAAGLVGETAVKETDASDSRAVKTSKGNVQAC